MIGFVCQNRHRTTIVSASVLSYTICITQNIEGSVYKYRAIVLMKKSTTSLVKQIACLYRMKLWKLV